MNFQSQPCSRTRRVLQNFILQITVSLMTILEAIERSDMIFMFAFILFCIKCLSHGSKRCNPIITTFYDFHTSLKLAQNKTDLLSSEIFENKRKIQGDPKMSRKHIAQEFRRKGTWSAVLLALM